MPDPLHALVYQLKRTRSLIVVREQRPKQICQVTLEKFMSFGLGSSAFGNTITCLGCANGAGKGSNHRACPNVGTLCCTACNLVKYCSDYCQKQHWSRHRLVCEHPLLNPDWQPAWIGEARKPTFLIHLSYRPPSQRPVESLWGNIPGFDCLQLKFNEGLDPRRNFKLCFPASGDIRDLVKTVNGLPKDYLGQCDILLNDIDAVTMNRNLAVLVALLGPGPSLDESAEVATHLMYSSGLTENTSTYVRRCLYQIYGNGSGDGDILFRSSPTIRGQGKIYAMQTSIGTKRPMEMFFSDLDAEKTNASRKDVLLDPMHEDERHRMFSDLKPEHRIAFMRFWETGILAPFALDASVFSRHNPLLFSPQGEWLGRKDANPLRGWDIPAVLQSGAKHGTEPADIFGCLFFHVKDELREFARRMKDFQINLHLTQFDARVLSKGLSVGVLNAFNGPIFDRVQLSNLLDIIGVRGCLVDWGPLINRENKHSSIVAYSANWHHGRSDATAKDNPRLMEILSKKCLASPDLQVRLGTIFDQGMHSPALIRLIESLDAFVDHEASFLDYLQEHEADFGLNKANLQVRKYHKVHPKRFGIPLAFPRQKLPNLLKEEFYNYFVLGNLQYSSRFVEFEGAGQTSSQENRGDRRARFA
ncbi:hypothetical protein BDN72DRAFT_654328 [Pluteus cervinus]|uniref:Uncharacterized protein n=1 Tax=Pluteus cervinus TaxID=181527 RepID=A0ACD3ASQ3_9AGAR|nr:hypothetical protein BDN72DRAFT_654328 [Pluteus cervinus]